MMLDMKSLLEHQALMAHHTSLGFNRSIGQPTCGYNRLGNQPKNYISRLSSRRACWSDNQPTVKDS
jgi:hypothetical protein